MKVKIYNTFEDEYLAKRWKEIVDSNGYFVQNSYEWCSIWWKHFHNRNRRLYIIAVLQDGDLVGIAPMFVQSRLGFRQLRFVGTGLTDFHQFLVERKFYKDGVDAILEHLKKFKIWDLVYLDQINDEYELYKYLESDGHMRKKYRVGCPIIDIDGLGWEEYIGNIRSGTVRREYWRKLRKLEKNVDLRFARIDTREELSLHINSLLKVYTERWSRRGRSDKFSYRDLRLFMREVFPSLTKDGKAVLYVLKDGERLISYRLGFVQDEVFYAWNTSFDPEYIRYSPGKVIMGYVINDLIERGYRALHFMRGDYKYKRQWMHKDREHISNNYLFLASKGNLKGEILERYYLFWRDKLKERFGAIIGNKYFRNVFRLDRQ